MQSRSTRFGLFATCLALGVACGGRSAIDFGADEGLGASAGVGGVGKGGTGTVGGSGGTVSGGSGGVGAAGSGGVGAISGGGGAGGGAGCESPATECEACNCKACPDQLESCNEDPGCSAILACAQKSGCAGVQCYLGPCQQVIDQNGGPFGDAATLAQQLGQCSNQNNCPCGGGGSGGAGGGGGGSGGGSGGGGPLACFQCVTQECPAVQECLIDTACRDGAICAFQNCLTGGNGGPDLQCMIKCFNGDFQAAIKAFQGFQCFFSKCGDTCGGIIPGLPGGGGGLPGG